MRREFDNLRRQLMRHEGLRLKPYRCTAGKLTIGYGRNLDDRGISSLEAAAMLDADIRQTVEECVAVFAWFNYLDTVRQDVVANMVFNLGIPKFMRFKNLIAALRAQDYRRAADEMLDSKWAQQVGARAEELAKQMRTGFYSTPV